MLAAASLRLIRATNPLLRDSNEPVENHAGFVGLGQPKALSTFTLDNRCQTLQLPDGGNSKYPSTVSLSLEMSTNIRRRRRASARYSAIIFESMSSMMFETANGSCRPAMPIILDELDSFNHSHASYPSLRDLRPCTSEMARPAETNSQRVGVVSHSITTLKSMQQPADRSPLGPKKCQEEGGT